MSRYKFQLKPAGAIAPDIDLTMKLVRQTVPEAQVVGEAVPVEPVVDPCPRLLFYTFTVLSAYTNLGPTYGVNCEDNELVIPYPPCCYEFRIYFSGCLPADVTLSYELVDVIDDTGNIQLQPVYDNYGDPIATAIGVFVSNQTYDALLLGSSFTVICFDSTNTQVGCGIRFACNPDAGTYRWEGWYVYRWDTQNPNAAPDTTYPEYNEEIVTVLWLTPGHVWGDYAAVNWTVTQTAGTAADLTIAPWTYGCRQWSVTREAGVSYAGTAYELQADIDGVPFGDVISISCEV